jgi:hypothetical protein
LQATRFLILQRHVTSYTDFSSCPARQPSGRAANAYPYSNKTKHIRPRALQVDIQLSQNFAPCKATRLACISLNFHIPTFVLVFCAVFQARETCPDLHASLLKRVSSGRIKEHSIRDTFRACALACWTRGCRVSKWGVRLDGLGKGGARAGCLFDLLKGEDTWVALLPCLMKQKGVGHVGIHPQWLVCLRENCFS